MKQKFIFSILFIIFSYSIVFSQNKNFTEIDKYSKNTPSEKAKSLDSLVNYLIKDYKTDENKIRSFYTWITNNIKFNTELYIKNPTKEQSANDVLNRRKSISYGYAVLFEKMCIKAKIPCHVVAGYYKNEDYVKNDIFYKSNHFWNIVKSDGNKWKIIDLALTAKSLQQKDKSLIFVKKENYFFISPKKSIMTHAPIYPSFQLLKCPVPMNIFTNSPMGIKDFLAKNKNYKNNFNDSIKRINLNFAEQKLETYKKGLKYNPNNHFDLANLYYEYANELRNGIFQISDKTKKKAELVKINAQLTQAQIHAKAYQTTIKLYYKNRNKENSNFNKFLIKSINLMKKQNDRALLKLSANKLSYKTEIANVKTLTKSLNKIGILNKDSEKANEKTAETGKEISISSKIDKNNIVISNLCKILNKQNSDKLLNKSKSKLAEIKQSEKMIDDVMNKTNTKILAYIALSNNISRKAYLEIEMQQKKHQIQTLFEQMYRDQNKISFKELRKINSSILKIGKNVKKSSAKAEITFQKNDILGEDNSSEKEIVKSAKLKQISTNNEIANTDLQKINELKLKTNKLKSQNKLLKKLQKAEQKRNSAYIKKLREQENFEIESYNSIIFKIKEKTLEAKGLIKAIK